MTRLFLSFAVSMVALMVFSSPVMAQQLWERAANPHHRVGIVIGEASPEAELVDDEIAGLVENQQGVLVRMRPVNTPRHDSMGQAIVEIRDRAHQSYFHEGATQTRDYLEKQLSEPLATTRQWMQDPEAARALFEAAIYLVRSHFDLGEADAAQRLLHKLVAALPAHEPDSRVVPPKVIEHWEGAVQVQRSGRARLDVAALGDESCRAVLNGARISSQSLSVEPGRTYVLGIDCQESQTSATHWVSAASGETRPIALAGEMVNTRQLQMTLEHWAISRDLDVAVYVGPGDCGQRFAQPCLAAWRRSQGFDVGFSPLHDDVVDEIMNAVKQHQ